MLTQEFLRVMLRCSRLLPWEAVVRQVEDFVLRMQFSGYTKKFSYKVVDSVLKDNRTMEDDDPRDESPMYRPKGWKRNEREQEKIKEKVNWYEKAGSESVIFVPATSGSQLQKEYQRQIRSRGFRVRVVEKAGESLKRILQRSNPLKERQHQRTDCLVCTTSGKGPSDGQGVRYEIVCERCDSLCVRKSSRSAYVGEVEHKKLLNKKDEQSVLWRHCKEKHGSELQSFSMYVTGVFPKDATLTQISEGIRIDMTPAYALINKN